MTSQTECTRSTFRFRKDLEANNYREWFAEYKRRYEQHLRDPTLRLIDCFVALGIWYPDSKAFRITRERTLEDSSRWRRVSGSTSFTGQHTLQDDSLEQTPGGFDPDHGLVEDLRRRDAIGVSPVPQTFITSSDLPRELARTFKKGVRPVRFLSDSLSVAF